MPLPLTNLARFKVTSEWARTGKELEWQILQDARVLAKGGKVPGTLGFCSVVELSQPLEHD